MEKNKQEEIIILIDNLLKQVQLLFKLAAKEARLAVYSFQVIIVLSLMSILIGISIWFTLLAFLGYEFYLYTQSISLSFSGVLLVNALIYLGMKLSIKLLKGNLSFKSTRQQILSIGAKDVV